MQFKGDWKLKKPESERWDGRGKRKKTLDTFNFPQRRMLGKTKMTFPLQPANRSGFQTHILDLQLPQISLAR